MPELDAQGPLKGRPDSQVERDYQLESQIYGTPAPLPVRAGSAQSSLLPLVRPSSATGLKTDETRSSNPSDATNALPQRSYGAIAYRTSA